jgi:Tol biopolymer transport system component
MNLTHPRLTVPHRPGAQGTHKRRLVLAVCVASSAMVLIGEARAQVTARASLSTGGAEGNGHSRTTSISADARYVAFWSAASTLVAGDTNGFQDIFVRDRLLGTTERVSVSTAGAQGNANCFDAPSISADGRYVAFTSAASNLVANDTNGTLDVFVRDRLLGTTERASVGAGGAQGNGTSVGATISADGRYVAFNSSSSNLVVSDTNASDDVFVRDRVGLSTQRVSVATGGTQGNGHSVNGSISADGSHVAFGSAASNLVAGDTNAVIDVYVRNRLLATTERVSVSTGGAQGNASSDHPSISADGSYVAFHGGATNLVAGDTNGVNDVFVRDRNLDTTARASVGLAGVQANGHSGAASISDDGRYVSFQSSASNLVALLDTNGFDDVFVRDRQLGSTWRASLHTGGTQGNQGSWAASSLVGGRYLAFTSAASNLVAGDTNASDDVFVHDREGTGFTSLCHPGVGGAVIACPCSNPPSGTGRGCDNSSGTGGAILSASGVAYLSTDSLVFTTSGEKPTATSIVMQGDAVAANGLVFGQGVRCVGGALERLYTKTAVGGSITAPDLGAGDPTVSARSIALGDVILAGQSRWYLVYYRDPVVLGGCPAASTFNATQTGRIDWSL